MKTVSIKEAENCLPELLSDPGPVVLTEEKSTEPTWVVLRIKDGAGGRYSVAGFTIIVLPEDGTIASQHVEKALSTETANAHSTANAPTFGSGKGTLTIVSEDDEHLKDFKEYMP